MMKEKFNNLILNVMQYKTNNLMIYNIAVGFFVSILIVSTIAFLYVLLS